MHKKIKIIVAVFALLVFSGLGAFAYIKFVSLKPYEYTTSKGQKYKLKSFPESKILDSAEVAKKLANTDIKPGTPMVVSYLKDDLGVALYITDTLDKPITKSCTGTERFAFSIDDYEVCKSVIKGQTSSLLAKVGNDGKYFMVVASMVYDGKRVTEGKDKAYVQEFNKFDLLQYQNKLKTIFKSVKPID